MTKHSPGPWRINNDEPPFAISDAEGRPVANVYEPTVERGAANARLVVSAFELLQFAFQFCDAIELKDLPTEGAPLHVRLKGLIRRIEGEE